MLNVCIAKLQNAKLQNETLKVVGVENPRKLRSWCGALHTNHIQSYAHALK